MSDPIIDLLSAPPVPTMHVDEDVIRVGGLRRVRRRRLIRGASTGLAVVAAAAAVWVALPQAATRDLAPAGSAIATRHTMSALDKTVAGIVSSPSAVPLKLDDGTRVWIDAGTLDQKGHMRLAARSTSGESLGAGSKATEPVGRPYNVPIDWTRTLLPDRLLVWGVDLEGTTDFKPDLNSGATVVSTATAVIPGTHSMVYVLDVRAPGASAPASVNVVAGVASKTPTSWPPKG